MDRISEDQIYAIDRPSSRLLFVYFLHSLATLFGFPFVFIPLMCKYLTLHYKFDREGVSASWGLLFKKQVYLTYARIQDIHLSRGLIERWVGLGTVDIQTASGSAAAELSVVGLEEYDTIRDFLYTKMRGFKGWDVPESSEPAATPDETLALLKAIRDELRAVRLHLEERRNGHV